eukprot:GILI01010717.1.p1 GENE.GILI01010717.1~~GILI01010717.1.p1  ORF type:complete len:182 (-),score=8.57 GILI01010717.1:189-734(-)
MGQTFSQRRWFGKSNRRVLVLGLDGAGKSTLISFFASKKPVSIEPSPTVNFDVKNVKFKKLNVCIWDVGGQERSRTFWRHYYTGTQGVIFVVDSCDRERMSIVCRELHEVANDPQLELAVFLILANKCDQSTAMSTDDITRELCLERLSPKHVWRVQQCVAKDGVGVVEGFSWLAEHMKPL